MMGEYEPITQQLRNDVVCYEDFNHCSRVQTSETHFNQICDNIDAIHRSLEQENERLRDASERGDDWIKLPIDVDGAPIHIGDMMEWRDHSGKFHEQTRVAAITNDGCYLYDSGLFHVNRIDLRHHKPDTWESIIEDAIDSMDGGPTIAALVARCKALAGEGE